MANITYPNVFSTGGTILASEMNANFNAITAQVNGNLDSNNLATGAVDENQLAPGAVTNAKVNANANIDASKLGTGVVSTTEFNFLNGVTSAIQTQLDAKLDDNNLTPSRALVSDANGNVASSAVTATELGYLDGVTSNIQTQLTALDTGKQDVVAGVSDTEIGYLSTVTSDIQTQLNAKLESVDTADITTGAVTPAKTSFMPYEAIYMGGVASAGGADSFLGLPSGWSASKTGTGTYLVTHNLGTAGYGIYLSRGWARVSGFGINSFNVSTYSHANSPVDLTLADSGFTFLVILK